MPGVERRSSAKTARALNTLAISLEKTFKNYLFISTDI